MIAYVFWHLPVPAVASADYEEALLTFHEALGNNPTRGFRESAVFQVQPVPWLNSSAGYEDWYLLDDLTALDELESGSVAGVLRQPHNGVAGMAGGGTAGLYRPYESEINIRQSTAVWFSKPRGVTYDGLLKKLGTESRPRLWRRALTLGPTPEFCLVGAGSDHLPYEWQGTLIVRRLLWPR